MDRKHTVYFLNYKGYTGKARFSEEDGVFVGEVINTPDSINFYADREDEIENMFRQSVDNYLEFLEEIKFAKQ